MKTAAFRLKTMMLFPALSLLIGSVFVLIIPTPVVAAGDPSETQYFQPDIRLPGQFDTEPINNQLMGKYIRAIYIYMVYVVSILAVVMIIWGGIKWVSAAGNPGQIKDAKDVIMNAIIGLVIALTSYTLLYIIKPDYLNLSLPEIHQVTRDYFDGAKVITYCDASQKVDCGQLREVVPGDNAADSTYCIGLKCDGHKVCNVTGPMGDSGQAKYFRKGRGCIDKITFDPPLKDGDRIFPTVPTSWASTSTETSALPVTMYCGKVLWDCHPLADGTETCTPAEVGRYCEAKNTECYMTTPTTSQEAREGSTYYYAKNMQCSKSW